MLYLLEYNAFPCIMRWLFVTQLILLVCGESRESNEPAQEASLGQCENELCARKSRRYLLYNVNPGEGFNLRRDIFIRVAPLVKSLNKHQTSHEWVLVLPPWGMVPHWKRTNPDLYFPWKRFFQVDKIRQYIPAVEIDDFMDEFGYDTPLDVVFQLQHYQFEENGDWSDKIESGVKCERNLDYRKSRESRWFTGLFWGQPIQAKQATCLAFRGQSSALRQFIIENDYRSVMFDRAEVILWDSYGDTNFWNARESLVFATSLQLAALDFLQQNGLTPSVNISYLDTSGTNNINTKISIRREYLGTHLRRADFMLGRLASELPSIPSTARQIIYKLKMLAIADVFIATDATKMGNWRNNFTYCAEVVELKNQIQAEMPGATVHFFRNEKLSDGECAIIDQIICSFSKHFVGTRDSTFTLRIFEEREIFGFDIDSNFNYLCPDQKEMECDKATQWRKSY